MSLEGQSKLVSIIIPLFNREDFIRTCVESCLKQTYPNIEIIVIDDGSTDNSKDRIMDYISSGKIEYYFQANSERSAARNHGIAKAKGEYIQFLDSDDLIFKNKIEKQMQFLSANPDYFGVRCKAEYLNEHGMTTHYADIPHAGYITSKLLKGNFIPIHAILFKKNDVKFNVNRRLLEDWEYWLYATFNQQVGYVDEVLCSVVLHETNSSSSDIVMRENEISVIKELMNSALFKRYYLRFCFMLFKKHFIILKLKTIFSFK